ncbi:F-box/LRR-repeat protein 4 [Hibiscus syriacus]|uniref:F-box/LRR-repeat protein 4 n=1 Tax=Hibiscus syriacus TaxID=106335 RepID=A0A6A2XZ95_HIBSY|nr:F-box/LRR-repeat protein 4 [Hibiscus syriacus]
MSSRRADLGDLTAARFQSQPRRMFPRLQTAVHIDERLSITLPFNAVQGKRRRRAENVLTSFKLHHAAEKSPEKEEDCESFCLTDASLTTVADGFSKLEKLSLIWCSNITSSGIMSLARKCKFLKSLDLQGCYVGDQGLAVIGQCCKQLEDLNLRFCESLTDVGLVELATQCGKSLKSLRVAACGRITDKSLEAVGSHGKSLETLSLDSELISNKGIIAIAQGCPLLKVLKLQCINVTGRALMAVGISCLSLEMLALYSFQQFTDEGLCSIGKGCKKLKNLTLSDCNFLGDRGLEAIASGCAELTHLEVNGCQNIGTIGLESVGKSGPYVYLLLLSLATDFFPCLYVYLLSAEARRLTELALLYCQRIGNFALTEIGRGCKYLQALNLVDCSSLGDEAICSIAKGCRNLKKLHIRRCYEVGSKGIFAVGENCHSLTDLSLRFCDRRVSLYFPSSLV